MSPRPLKLLFVLFLAGHALGLSLHLKYVSDTDHLAVPVRIRVDDRLVASSGRFVSAVVVGLKQSKLERLRTLTVELGRNSFRFTAAEVRACWQQQPGEPGPDGEPVRLLKAPPEVALPATPLPFVGDAINSPGAWALAKGYLPWAIVSGLFLLAAWLLGRAARHTPPLAEALRRGFAALDDSAPGRSWPWLLGGALVVLVAFVRLETLEPYYFLQDDNLVQWFPAVRFACASLTGGEWPEWNPYQLGGAPLLSLGYFALTYPPLLLSYLLATYLLGNDLWTIEVFALLHLLAGYALSYACARAVRLRPSLAMAGALCIVLSGYSLIAGRSWITLGVTWLVLLPLLTLCLIRLWRAEVGWKWALLTGLVVGLWYHVGFAQTWVYGLTFLGLAVGLLWLTGELPSRRLAWAALALLQGVAMAVPLLYVQTNVVGDIEREKSYGNGITSGAVASLLPYPLATAPHPSEWGSHDSELMGQFYYWGSLFTGAVLLALMLPLAVRGLLERTFVARNLWLILAGVALLLSLGEAGGLWPMLSGLPVFGRINNHPFRVLPQLIFFGVLGGGLFLQRFVSAWPRWTPRLGWAAVVTAGLMLYHVNLCRPAFYSYAERPYPPLPTELRQLLASAPEGRILSFAPDRSAAPGYMRGLRHGLPTVYGVPSLCGYDPLVESTQPYKSIRRKLDEEPVQTARALGVRWILTGGPTSEPSWPEGTINYHWCDQGARARRPKFSLELQQRLEKAGSPRLNLDGLRVSELPDPAPLAFWAEQPRVGPAVRCRANGVDIDVSARPEGGTLVINVLARPQWQALAGDASLGISASEWHRVRVTVPPGTQDVALRFRPPWAVGFRYALVLEGAVLLAGLFLARRVRARARAEVDAAALNDQRPLAHLEVNGQHILAQHAQEEELQPRQEEQSDDQRRDAGRRQLLVVDQVCDERE
jgi:hypothetical protein